AGRGSGALVEGEVGDGIRRRRRRRGRVVAADRQDRRAVRAQRRARRAGGGQVARLLSPHQRVVQDADDKRLTGFPRREGQGPGGRGVVGTGGGGAVGRRVAN